MGRFDNQNGIRGAWPVSLLLCITAVLLWIFYTVDPAAIHTDGGLPGEIEVSPTPTPASGGLVALTFDDGPRRSTTTALLNGLAERGVKATFFLVGSQISNNCTQDIVLRMDQDGHQIGIHTYDHVQLSGLNNADFRAQVDKTRSLLQTIIGHNGFLLRPPYGTTDAGVRRRAGCPIILWSIDPEDWNDKNVDRIVEHVVSNTKDGDIILLHDIYPSSVDAALRIVDQLHKRNFYFVTIDELFANRQIPLEAGHIYRDAYP